MTDLERFRKEKDNFFRTDYQSPLTQEQKRNFTGLIYFPENPALHLEVTIEPFEQVEKIEMQTTTGDIQSYIRFGKFHFTVDGQPAELTIFFDGNYYFLPFVDSQAGKLTYGAGRYLEPEPLGGNRFLVDFNLAYNPYCAYNETWSCPITPWENRLKVPIQAGEKVFHEE